MGRLGRWGGGHNRGSLQVRGVGEGGRWTQQGITAGEGQGLGGRGRLTQQGVTTGDGGGGGEGEVDIAGGHSRCGAVGEGGRWPQQGVIAGEGGGGGRCTQQGVIAGCRGCYPTW